MSDTPLIDPFTNTPIFEGAKITFPVWFKPDMLSEVTDELNALNQALIRCYKKHEVTNDA